METCCFTLIQSQPVGLCNCWKDQRIPILTHLVPRLATLYSCVAVCKARPYRSNPQHDTPYHRYSFPKATLFLGQLQIHTPFHTSLAHTITTNWHKGLIFYPFCPFTWFCGPYRGPCVSVKPYPFSCFFFSFFFCSRVTTWLGRVTPRLLLPDVKMYKFSITFPCSKLNMYWIWLKINV